MASTARRIAGSVGLGGPWRNFFSPARLREAAALQVGVGDHRHERVAVQAMPGSAFEVIEAEFFLEPLVGLLADPARLDRGGEPHRSAVLVVVTAPPPKVHLYDGHPLPFFARR